MLALSTTSLTDESRPERSASSQQSSKMMRPYANSTLKSCVPTIWRPSQHWVKVCLWITWWMDTCSTKRWHCVRCRRVLRCLPVLTYGHLVDKGKDIIDRERRVWKKAVSHALKQVCAVGALHVYWINTRSTGTSWQIQKCVAPCAGWNIKGVIRHNSMQYVGGCHLGLLEPRDRSHVGCPARKFSRRQLLDGRYSQNSLI